MDTNVQPISDDQELAKVLAGVTQDINSPSVQDPGVTSPASVGISSPEPVIPDPVTSPVVDTPAVVSPDPQPLTPQVGASGELDSIKLEALQELRPLVDKLNVSPEEKFDTYLLLLRSTDDKDLIEPAHEAAKGIADEARRAQALLDIIKEIDFLSQNK